MKKQGGFTLIELVVVIVILGILAVTAAPKFLNLQSDARASSLQGLKGAMAGAAGIVYGKAAIDGSERVANLSADLATASAAGIAIHFGYPTPTENGIVEAVVGLKDDWEVTTSGATQLVIRFPSGANDECNVVYTQAKDANTPPVITAGDAKKC